MNYLLRKFVLSGMLTCGISTGAMADATSELFSRLDKGDCQPSSLTSGTWTITTGPVGTHGELNWDDELIFVQTNEAISLSRKSKFNIWKNGVAWISSSGWNGSCVRDGNLSLYVVTGIVMIEGCPHELAIGRLDHDDSLGNRIEVIFQDADSGEEGYCTHGGGEALLHPGHAHGDND